MQLALDGLPVLVMVLHILSWLTVRMQCDGTGTYDMQAGWFYRVTLACLMVLPIPAFVAGFLWRDKAFALFEQHRVCRLSSNVLRIIGALVVSVVFLFDIFYIAALVSV